MTTRAHRFTQAHYISLQINGKALIKFDHDCIHKCAITLPEMLWDNRIKYVYSGISRIPLLSKNSTEHWAPAFFLSRWLCIFFCLAVLSIGPLHHTDTSSILLSSPDNSHKSLTQIQWVLVENNWMCAVLPLPRACPSLTQWNTTERKM